MTDNRELSAQEVEEVRREHLFVDATEITPVDYPSLWNNSAAFMYEAVIRAKTPDRLEYVTIPIADSQELEMTGIMAR